MAGQLEKSWMKTNHVTDALEDRGFQVVIEQAAWDAFKRLEGRHMATQEALERLVEHEAREDRAAPGQDHHEARQCPPRIANGDRPKAGPVHLPLLAR